MLFLLHHNFEILEHIEISLHFNVAFFPVFYRAFDG